MTDNDSVNILVFFFLHNFDSFRQLSSDFVHIYTTPLPSETVCLEGK